MVRGVGGGQNYPKVRPLPRRHNHSHGPCLQFFLNDQVSGTPPDHWSPWGPLCIHFTPWGQHSPSILQFCPRQMLSPLLFPPTTCSKFNVHCFCHEIFALYLPNICSLKKFAKCVALVGENTFPLSVSIWFFLPVCACV